jgi:uncharacterized membrane-anchored protein
MPSEVVLGALEELHLQIERMQPAIRQVEIAEELINEVKKLPEEHVNLIGRIKEQELRFKDKISNELKGYAQELGQQVNVVVKTADGTMSNLAKHDEQLQALRENIKVYYNKMSGMQLDLRLDSIQRTCESKLEKLDASTGAIQMGIQNIQGRLDLIETNIANRLKEEGDKQRAMLVQVQSQLKQQRVLTILTWVLIVIATAAILVLKK